MMKPLAIASFVALSALALGCSGAPAEDDADSTSEDLKKKKDPLPSTITKNIEIPISAATIGVDGMGMLHVDLPDLWKETKLSHQPRMWFEVPPRDGESCDDACVAKIIARAKAKGGTLTGKMTITLGFRDVQRGDGTCGRLLEEEVVIDMKKATHGIYPDIEEMYDFLTLTELDPPRVDIMTIPCK